jgi:hypothetical protein
MFNKLIGVAFFCTTASALATDVTVYKWIDKDDVVHYSQDQPSGKSYEKVDVEVAYKPSEIPNTANTDDFLAAIEKKKQQERLNKEAIERAQTIENNCQAAQVNIKILNGFNKILVSDPSGEQRILSPEEKAEQLTLTKKHIDIFCNAKTKDNK